MIRTRGAAAAAVVAALWAGHASADELISNLPGNDGSQSAALEGGRIKAMGFTMPGGPDYAFERADIRLAVDGLEVDPLVRLFEDSGGFAGELLLELSDPPITSVGIETYSFTSRSPLVLEGGQTYWLVVYNVGGSSIDWKASSPTLAPTGIASHAGSYFSTSSGPNPPTTSSSIFTSYAIHGSELGGCYADCDESGELDFFDFLCFQNEFAAGCP